jgi:hypothetical protein
MPTVVLRWRPALCGTWPVAYADGTDIWPSASCAIPVVRCWYFSNLVKLYVIWLSLNLAYKAISNGGRSLSLILFHTRWCWSLEHVNSMDCSFSFVLLGVVMCIMTISNNTCFLKMLFWSQTQMSLFSRPSISSRNLSQLYCSLPYESLKNCVYNILSYITAGQDRVTICVSVNGSCHAPMVQKVKGTARLHTSASRHGDSRARACAVRRGVAPTHRGPGEKRHRRMAAPQVRGCTGDSRARARVTRQKEAPAHRAWGQARSSADTSRLGAALWVRGWVVDMSILHYYFVS